MIVQWKLPPSVSSFIQRSGRTVRGTGRSGRAAPYACRTIYDLSIRQILSKHLWPRTQQRHKERRVDAYARPPTTYPKSSEKGYAEERGVPPMRFQSITTPVTRVYMAWLYGLVHTVICRRRFLHFMYRNTKAERKWIGVKIDLIR